MFQNRAALVTVNSWRSCFVALKNMIGTWHFELSNRSTAVKYNLVLHKQEIWPPKFGHFSVKWLYENATHFTYLALLESEEYWLSHTHPAVFYGQLSATSIDNNRPVLTRNNESGDDKDHERQSRSANLQLMLIKETSIAAAEPFGVLKNKYFAVVCTYG